MIIWQYAELMWIQVGLTTWDAGSTYIAYDSLPVLPLRCLFDIVCSKIYPGRKFLQATSVFRVQERTDAEYRTLTNPVGIILQNLSLESRVQTSNMLRHSVSSTYNVCFSQLMKRSSVVRGDQSAAYRREGELNTTQTMKDD